MPQIDKARYYDVKLVDLYTNNYGYIGRLQSTSDVESTEED